MPRKISTGVTGGAVLGRLKALDTELSPILNNQSITVSPSGNGQVVSTKDVEVTSSSKLKFSLGLGQNFVSIKGPNSAIGANVELTLPAAMGSGGQVMTTTGDGELSFQTISLPVTNNTASSATFYPTLTTQTSGSETTITTSSTRLSFQPSTGRLSSTELRATANTASTSTTTGALVVTGGVGVGGSIVASSIQNTPIGSTTRSTGAFTTLTSNAATTFTANTASTSTTTGTLVVTGGVGIGGQMTATSIVETSSIALKENIEPIQDALTAITQLSGVTYDRKDNGEHESGLIAEWVDTVLPDLVTRDQNGGVVGIKYTKLTAYLIEAVKTLKAEIDGLKNK